jgi:hypothetical protein
MGMKASQVSEKLLAEGCSESNFVVNGTGSDVYCLAQRNGVWVVFYTERGQDSPPEFKSKSEEEACQFFYDFIMKMEHWHIVGFFKLESEAEALEAELASIGVPAIRNDIPAYRQRNDPRYRVFVVGKDIFRVRDAIGEPTITYA